MSPTPTACSACHVNNNYTLNSSDCYGCHSAVYQGTATIGGSVPNHVAAGFPTTAAAVRFLPPDHDVVRGNLQSQHDRISSDQ